MKRETVIQKIAEQEAGILIDDGQKAIEELIVEGNMGLNELTDEELQSEYKEIFEQEIIIKG